MVNETQEEVQDEASPRKNGDGSDNKEDTPDIENPFDRWEEVGFQRPLADFFYDYFFFIIVLIVGIVFISMVYPLIYPFPEIRGYNDVAKALFAWIYSVFDSGTAFGIVQFVAHYRVKNPKIGRASCRERVCHRV